MYVYTNECMYVCICFQKKWRVSLNDICVYEFMYVCMYVRMSVYMYVYAFRRNGVCLKNMQVYTYVGMRVCANECMYVYICMQKKQRVSEEYMCVHTLNIYTHTYIYKYIYKFTSIYV